MHEVDPLVQGGGSIPGTTPWLRNVAITLAGYSLAERDRRWAAVRAGAQAAGLDGILVPLGNDTDARFLTLLRNAIVVLPAGEATPIVAAPRGTSNEWVPTPRPAGRDWAAAMAEALHDAGLARG